MKSKKVIIFDLDGTLIDTDKLIFMSYRHLFQKYGNGYEPSFSEYISFLGPTLMETFPKYFKEDVDLLIKEYRSYGEKNDKYFLSPIKGAKEVLENLQQKGYKLAVVSSKIKKAIIKNLSDLNMDMYFDFIIGADEVQGKYKPDPYGLIIALNHFNFSKEDAVYIGDSFGDLLCAKNAQIDFIAVNYSLKGKFYKEEKVISIDSLYDLLTLF